MGTKTQRFGRVLGGLLASAIIIGMAGFVVWALPQLDERGKDQTLNGTSTSDDVLSRVLGDLRKYSNESQDLTLDPRGESRAFSFNMPRPTGSKGAPGHWCVRQPIGYRIDFTGADLAGMDRTRELYRWEQAFEQWSEASNRKYTFEYRGQASYPVPSPNADVPIELSSIPQGEIAIAYAAPRARNEDRWQGRLYRPLGGLLGTGGVQQVSWVGESAGIIQKGLVVLNPTKVRKSALDVPAVYPHELGHALGLAHPARSGQLMSEASGEQAVMQTGDREGIRRLARAGC